ncbi:molybdopterin converting factor small subunit [Nocardioides daedukensis]|uniref:Molybdopterin synthase sulfur carrier subunit n=1 Tax=Nocardioides daedukensis TaxID=634462 RepID=A0A7Y9S4S5_9ACTN|nr:molybdopterin converting factor small subunit [Nocardioides daedukensis]
MSPQNVEQPDQETQVVVRYWAAARAVTGVNEDHFDGPLTLTELRGRILERHPGAERVIGICSMLVDDEPAGSLDPDTVRVRPGQSVEFLPPFAGG